MMQDLLAATVRLATTLAAENAALQALNLPAAASLLPEKEAATAAFNAARSGAITGPTAPLRDAAAQLMEQAERNRLLLERAIKVQTRVIGVVAGAGRPAQPVARYGRSGAYAPRPATGFALSARA